MARYPPLWEQLSSYAASVDRRLIGTLWPAAACQGCAQTVAGSTLQVNIAPGAVAVPAANGTGSTLCVSDAVETVTHSSGLSQPRIDLITCHPRGNDLDGGQNNDWIFDIVQGTPAATPVAPALPAGQALIAQVTVPANAVSLVQANIADGRPPRLNGLAEPALAAGAPLQSFADVTGEVFVAKGGVKGGAWRKARDVMHARVYRNATLPIAATTWTSMACDTADFDDYGMLSAGGIAVPVAGYWHFGGAAGTNPSTRWIAAIYRNGVNAAQGLSVVVGSSAVGGGVETVLRCAAGDAITLQMYSGVASTVTPLGPASVYLTADYLGTG